jgi:hypothetical protein
MGSMAIEDWILGEPHCKRVSLMPSRVAGRRVIEAGRAQPQIKMNFQRTHFDGVEVVTAE